MEEEVARVVGSSPEIPAKSSSQLDLTPAMLHVSWSEKLVGWMASVCLKEAIIHARVRILVVWLLGTTYNLVNNPHLPVFK